MFQIDLTALEPGVHHLTRQVEPGALRPDESSGEEAPASGEAASEDDDTPGDFADSSEATFGAVHVDAVVDYAPEQVLVMLQVQATATLTCDRTLRRFEEPVEGSYAVLFAPPERGAPDESDDHDELRDLPPGARFLDLTDVLHDTLLLAVPQRKVAPGAEDEDIETTFGAPDPEANEPVDPRFAKLRELQQPDESDD